MFNLTIFSYLEWSVKKRRNIINDLNVASELHFKLYLDGLHPINASQLVRLYKISADDSVS